MKRCGLYTRVSTEDQAQVKDGSLETQMDLLERHVQLKADSTDETWRLVIRVKPSVQGGTQDQVPPGTEGVPRLRTVTRSTGLRESGPAR